MRTITKLSLTGLLAAPILAFSFATATPASADELHISFGSGGVGFSINIDGRDHYGDRYNDRRFRDQRIFRQGHLVTHRHRMGIRWFTHSHAIQQNFRRGRGRASLDRLMAHSHGPEFWNVRGFRNGFWFSNPRDGRRFRSLRGNRGVINNNRGGRRGLNTQTNNQGAGNRGGNRAGNQGGGNRNGNQVIVNNGGQVVVDNGGRQRRGNGGRRNRQLTDASLASQCQPRVVTPARGCCVGFKRLPWHGERGRYRGARRDFDDCPPQYPLRFHPSFCFRHIWPTRRGVW